MPSILLLEVEIVVIEYMNHGKLDDHIRMPSAGAEEGLERSKSIVLNYTTVDLPDP